LKPDRPKPQTQDTRDSILIAAGVSWPYIVERRRTQFPAALAGSADNDRALAHLQDFFGNDVLALPQPLFDRLINVAPWTYDWIRWFSDSLSRLASAVGCERLRERLTDPDRFMEAWSVLQIAERIQATGCQIAFDVKINVDQVRKIPDLLIIDPGTNKSFICEVSVLYSALAQQRQSALLDQIFQLFGFQEGDPLVYAGCILPSAWEQDMGGLLNRVAWEIMETRRDQEYREFTVENGLTMASAPNAQSARVESWAKAHGVELGGLCAMPPAIDHLRRLREKILEKAAPTFSGRTQFTRTLGSGPFHQRPKPD
jgi:hypothetical protein